MRGEIPAGRFLASLVLTQFVRDLIEFFRRRRSFSRPSTRKITSVRLPSLVQRMLRSFPCRKNTMDQQSAPLRPKPLAQMAARRISNPPKAARCSPQIREPSSLTTKTPSKPGFAARPCSKISSCAKRSRISITSEFPSGSSTRAVPGLMVSFEPYESLKQVTSAAFLADPSVKTPVFARFSTVAGERWIGAICPATCAGLPSNSTPSEGNFDLVGQQYSRLLYSGCHEVPGPYPCGQDGSRTADSASGHRLTTPFGISSR